MKTQFDYRGFSVVIERRGDLYKIIVDDKILDQGRSSESLPELVALAKILIEEK